MDIRLIRNDDDHAAAVREIERLWGVEPGTADSDKLDVLAILVEKYEDDRWPDEDVSDPADLLNYAIDELGHTQAELAELLGSRSRASEVLSRRRAFTVDDPQDQRSVEDTSGASRAPHPLRGIE